MACYMQTNKKQNTREKKNAIRMVNKKSHRPPCESDHFKNKKKERKGNYIDEIIIIIIIIIIFERLSSRQEVRFSLLKTTNTLVAHSFHISTIHQKS